MNAYLSKCSNLFGSIGPDIRARLEAVIAAPTESTWDNAYSIIVNGRKMMTLWQAWIAVDPTAPRTGPVENQRGKRISGWARIPDQLTIYKALRYATSQ